jgi:hypothetical protein
MSHSRLILLILAASFLTLAIDIRHMHVEVTKDHPTAWIPIIYGSAACAACLAALFTTGKGKYVVAGILAFGPIVGGLGAWFHYQDSPGILALTVRQGLPGGEKLMKEPSEDDYPSPGAPPLLAPLSFVGLSLLGMVVALSDEKKGSRSKSK